MRDSNIRCDDYLRCSVTCLPHPLLGSRRANRHIDLPTDISGGCGRPPFAASSLAAFLKDVPVGLELYSVRTELQKDLKGTVTAVAKAGYQVVEFYSPYLDWTPDTAKDVRKLLDDLGIKCHSTHNNGPSFTDDGLKKAIELNQIIGSKYIIMASAGKVTGVDGWKAVGDRLTKVADTLRPLNMATGLSQPSARVATRRGQAADGRARRKHAEGRGPAARRRHVRGSRRRPRRVDHQQPRTHPQHSLQGLGRGQGRGYAVAFGEGDVPWKKIFDAAESAGGVEYHLIEQEESPDQIQMAQRCLENWKKLHG